MPSSLQRINPAITLVALLISLLALVAGAAGAGYAVATIGTAQLKNNAVTAQKIKKNAVTTKKIKKNAVTADKVKDGSLTAADLAKGEVEHAPAFSNGGEGDCVWTDAATTVSGLNRVSFRKDALGTVHLAGILIGADGPGGDADCDSGAVGQASDAVVFTLPAGYVPAKTVVFGGLGATGVVVTGTQGVTIGTLALPPGAVATGVGGGPTLLNGITFEPAEAGVTLPRMATSGHGSRQLLEALGLS